MVTPRLVLDSRERWRPVPVEDSLTRLGYTWVDGGFKCRGRGVPRLNFPRSMQAEEFTDLPVVGYRRSVAGGGLYWHQFWTWWLYNPKKYAGFGEHEGDWEMVQFGCTDEAGDHPVLASYAQHGGGEKREFWRVSLDGDMPIAYVARDSHAAYFKPERDVTDTADGAGEHLDMAWRDFGPWADWSGRWGNSDNSPGPLPPRRAWRAAHAWHGQAR